MDVQPPDPRCRIAAPSAIIRNFTAAVLVGLQINQPRTIRFIGVLLCAITIVGGGANIVQDYNSAFAAAERQLENLGTILTAQADRYIQVIDILLHTVESRVAEQAIDTPAVLRARFAADDNRAFMSILVRTIHPRNSVAVFDAAGDLVARGQPGAGAINVVDRPYFTMLRDHPDAGMVIGEPKISRTTRTLSFFVARRLSAPDGTFLGVVVATIGISYLRDLYQVVSKNDTLTIMLLRQDGTVLLRQPAHEAAALGTLPRSQWSDWVKAGRGTFRGRDNAENRPSLVSVHPLRDYPLVLTVAEGEDQVLATWRREALYTVFAALSIVCAIMILFAGITRAMRSQQEYNRVLSSNAAALQASERRLDRAQEIAQLGSWDHDIRNRRIVWSRNLYRLYGVDPRFEPDVAFITSIILPADIPHWKQWYADLCAGQQRGPIDLRVRRQDGAVRTMQVQAGLDTDPDQGVLCVTGTARDVTDLRKLEAELAQAQKMEVIGNLAGGFAHDSNNVLGIVIGNLDLLQPMIESNPEARELWTEALDGALRCADLTKRMLAFARRQPLHPQIADINTLVQDISQLLRRTLGASVELKLDLEPGTWPAMVDAVQLQAAIVNLAANARDAMPQGGQLRIAIANVVVTPDVAGQHDGMAPGDYVAVTVRDTGTGMTPEVMERIFEPFFTTKGPNKGTGLGLSMVFGFVRQSGGSISVLSEPDVGTCFRIYLPRVAVPQPGPAAPAGTDGNETILLVDDSPALRRAVSRQLAGLGYRVLEADDAGGALRILNDTASVHLLLSDVVLDRDPDGIDLALEATRRSPGLRVLLMSGYPKVRDARQRLLSCGFPLLEKPFFHDELGVRIRQALADGTAAAPGQTDAGLTPSSAALAGSCP